MFLETSKDWVVSVICNTEEPRSAVGIGKHGWNAGHDVYFFPPGGGHRLSGNFSKLHFQFFTCVLFPSYFLLL